MVTFGRQRVSDTLVEEEICDADSADRVANVIGEAVESVVEPLATRDSTEAAIAELKVTIDRFIQAMDERERNRDQRERQRVQADAERERYRDERERQRDERARELRTGLAQLARASPRTRPGRATQRTLSMSPKCARSSTAGWRSGSASSAH